MDVKLCAVRVQAQQKGLHCWLVFPATFSWIPFVFNSLKYWFRFYIAVLNAKTYNRSVSGVLNPHPNKKKRASKSKDDTLEKIATVWLFQKLNKYIL